MVAKIKIGKRILGVLNYNEHKVGQGKAACIGASGYGREAQELNFYEKLSRFEGLMELNPKVKTNTLHISLNFDPSEKPDDELLQQIASAYMEKIGFGDQPFLVYRHRDAAHDHIHLVSTIIRSDGSRIDLHNIGRTRSETARKDLEIEFGLIKAESKKQEENIRLKPLDLNKVSYGKAETKRAVTDIVAAVTSGYNYTSLTELNAILRKFNVIADRGKADSQMFEKKGLIYSLMDEKGNKIGVPIKASIIYGKPTLASLEERFMQNKEIRKPMKEELKERLSQILDSSLILTRGDWMKECRKIDVEVLFHTNDKGFTYGVTYIDQKHKAAFKGSDIGKEFSAAAIHDRFAKQDITDDRMEKSLTGWQRIESTSLNNVAEPGKKQLDPSGADFHQKDQNPLRGIVALNKTRESLPDELFLPQWEDKQGPDPKLKRKRKKRMHH
ncbi:Putative conjugative transposon mobilization protein [Arcticibacter svalbardensis MN12-7]|uniref:Putative conjugative transposon mobilization protein n=1 Tax=Arcticibacter svalbardensis MN12-7 TaxID=1150600 RepID=R9GXS5_9SPHI|nr:relaxase/mobilization nuclease domain-containing protein [Arcticibacter svalbardensis]EOR96305.1 Putative conjugative transposon mobilization protein [Arcticibacter svalbardensis MN12-7]